MSDEFGRYSQGCIGNVFQLNPSAPLRTAFIAAACLLFVSLPGCAGAPVQAMHPVQAEATKHDQRGIRDAARGDYEAALRELAEARRLHGSVENSDGTVVTLINIARVNRLRGDIPAARRAIEEASSLMQDRPDFAAELCYEKAKILLAAGDLAAAKKWAGQAVAAERGNLLGRRNNLLGRLLFREGAFQEAARQAETALKQNRESGMREEEANSLRLLGDANRLLGLHDPAFAFYSQALGIDKELGLSGKIAADLEGLAIVSTNRKDIADAIRFYERACEVSLHAGNTAAAVRQMGQLAALYKESGENEKADRILEERRNLLTAAGK